MATLKKNLKSSFGLSSQTITLLYSVFSKFPAIEEVKIFGSRALGNFRPGSDIDLAVYSQSMSYNQFLDVRLALDDLELLYKIDLIDYNKIDHQDLKGHIDQAGKSFYKA